MKLLFIFIIIIVLLQIWVFFNTRFKIKRYKKFLSGTFSIDHLTLSKAAKFEEITDEADNVYFVDAEGNCVQDKDEIADDSNIETLSYTPPTGSKVDELTEDVTASINEYLEKNIGAVSDFNLIKDIVERNGENLDSEITNQTPLPLYLGLMGTILGIILGLGSDFIYSQTDVNVTIGDNINNLMVEVGVAMIASFFGILLTTISIWNSKNCKTEVEDNKNGFYFWFQSNMLPNMSRNAVSAIGQLQQNLTSFNTSFKKTVGRMEKALSEVGDMFGGQLEILDRIQKIDINRVASANVKVLEALERSMGSIRKLSEYIDNSTEYIQRVTVLNNKIDAHLERTQALETIAYFYKEQLSEIRNRQTAVQEAVISVDNVMKKTLAEFAENSDESIQALKETLMSQINDFQRAAKETTQGFEDQLHNMPQILDRMSDVAKIPERFDKTIARIEQSNNALFEKVLSNIEQSNQRMLKKLPSASTMVGGSSESAVGGANAYMPKWLQIVIAVSLILIVTCAGIITAKILGLTEDYTETVVEAPDTLRVERVTSDAATVPAAEVSSDVSTAATTNRPKPTQSVLNQRADTHKDSAPNQKNNE